MDKYKIKEQMRKIKWATEHQTGKRLGKKGLIEVQKVVMDMNKATEPKEQPKQEFSTWRGNTAKLEPEKIAVDLSNLIGNKFHCHLKSA